MKLTMIKCEQSTWDQSPTMNILPEKGGTGRILASYLAVPGFCIWNTIGMGKSFYISITKHDMNSVNSQHTRYTYTETVFA